MPLEILARLLELRGFIVLPLMPLMLAYGAIHHAFGKDSLPAFFWRWMSGHTVLSKDHFTDATWTRPGTKVLHPSGNAHRWHHKPRMHRAGIRSGLTVLTGLLCYGMTQHRTGTALSLVWVAGLALVTCLVLGIRSGRRWHHRRMIVHPLASVLATLAQESQMGMRKRISIPHTFMKVKSGKMGSISFPDSFRTEPEHMDRIGRLVVSRLPVDADIRWHTSGREPCLTLHAAPKLPAMVRFAKVASDIRQLSQHEVMLGVTADGSHKVWDMKSDEPHFLGSAQTRRGKTRLAMLVMSQVLNRGGRVIAVDPKRVGLDEFMAGHPKAKVYSEPREVEASMWTPIREFKALLNERIDAYKDDRTIEFDRALLVIDEISIWASLSKVYWDQNKPSKAKATPPVFYDLAEILYAGAQFSCNVMIFGQVLGHNVLGNTVECFGIKALGGYSRQAYMRLIGIMPIPASQKARGRFLIHDGGETPVWVQTILGEIQELRDFALEPYRKQTAISDHAVIPGEVISEKVS